MSKKSPQVFLDANIVIAAGKPPGGLEIERVKDLAEAGLIEVLTTDLTVTEVAKKHAQNEFDLIHGICHPHFRTAVEAATGVALPKISVADMRAQLKARYEAATQAMFSALGARTLKIDEIKASVVFDAYASGEGFFSGKAKKDQFPDAFIFECLKGTASKKAPVIIVSADGDFTGPVAGAKHVTLVKSMPDLFERLGLEMAAPAVDTFLEGEDDRLIELVNRELTSWGLQSSDVMDAEIDEVVVEGLEIGKVTAFKPLEENGSILVIAIIEARAAISYTHPNWDEAMYDSEDKVAIPFGNVSGETEIELVLNVALSVAVGEKGKPAAIEALRFRNADFQYVTLYPPDQYK